MKPITMLHDVISVVLTANLRHRNSANSIGINASLFIRLRLEVDHGTAFVRFTEPMLLKNKQIGLVHRSREGHGNTAALSELRCPTHIS